MAKKTVKKLWDNPNGKDGRTVGVVATGVTQKEIDQAIGIVMAAYPDNMVQVMVYSSVDNAAPCLAQAIAIGDDVSIEYYDHKTRAALWEVSKQ